MIKLGNFLFRYRNGLFPFAYAMALFRAGRILDKNLHAALLGFVIALAGQTFRAQTIGLAYIRRGGQNRRVYADELVTGGLFAHCRNPLYVGNFVILAGVGIAANSRLFATLGLLFFFVAYWAIILAEENFLRNKFGPQFDAYCRSVPRILLKARGLRTTIRGMDFNWRRLIVKEYGTTFAWTAGMTLIVIRNQWLDEGYEASQHIIWALGGVLILLTLAYGTARYLKRKAILKAD